MTRSYSRSRPVPPNDHACRALAVAAGLLLAPHHARAQTSEPTAAQTSEPTAAQTSEPTAAQRDPAANPPPPAAASTTEPHALPKVVVSAESLDDSQPRELEKYGTRVTRVSSQELQNLGSVDVAEGLQVTVPGLYISPKNGPFDYVNVSLQASRTQDVLWLLDGVRLNNRLYGGTTPLDTFPASIVDHLEVLDGTQALLYGTQAVAGAINVVTKPFSSELGGSLGGGADTSGGRHLDAFVRDGIGKHRFVVYGSSDHSNGFQPFRDRDYQPSSTDRHRSYDVLTLGAKYAYQITSQLRISAVYQHTDARLDFAMPFAVASAYNRRAEDVLTAKLDFAPSEATRLTAKAYLHEWRSHYTEFDNVIGSPGTLTSVDNDDAWGYRDYGVNALGQLGLGPWLSASLGYDLQSYTGNDAVLVIDKKTEHVHAVFAQLRTSERVPRAHLALGFRYNAPSFGPSAAVWSASGRYDIVGEALFVRSTVGTAFRLPTAEELFANDPNDERGNPNLEPEKSFDLNASIAGNWPVAAARGVSWEAILFARNVKNLISASGFDDATNQSLFENTAGTVRVRGGTALVEARPLDALSVSASYSYTSARQVGDLQTDGVPEQLAKVWLDYHPYELPFGLTATVNHVGSVYKTFGDDDREKFGNYTVVDFAGRVFFDQTRQHTVSVRLANVFDTEYATALARGTRDADGGAYTYWHLGIPRTFEARYRYDF